MRGANAHPAGARTPIAHALLVHGAGGGAWEWNVWRGAFEARGVSVVAPDLRPAPTGIAATRFDDYASQVRSAIATLPRPRALVGASLGGLLAIECAGAADALVLVNPIPPAPWASRLPTRDWPAVVRWGRDARLASTRRALPDADVATALYAFRRWRDESDEVLRAAHAGIAISPPRCPVLCLVSEGDEDVPAAAVCTMAAEWRAGVLRLPHSSHVGPLLGDGAASAAVQALAWLSAR